MKFYIFPISLLIIVTTLILQSFSSILTIGAAIIVTTAWNDPRSIDTQLDDKIIEIYITRTLNKYLYTKKKSSRIINTVYQGNVLLTGQSSSITLPKKVEKIIKNINGTNKIYNEIRHNQPISFQSILLDFWTSNQIRLNFIKHEKIHTSNIKIITENKEIFLLGQVTHDEEKHAIEIIQKIKRIKNIYTFFVYI